MLFRSARERNGTHAPEFNSLSFHGKITKRDGTPANTSTEGGEEWSVKIFSTERVEDRWLRRVFGQVGWVYRTEVRLFDLDARCRCVRMVLMLVGMDVVGRVPVPHAHAELPADQAREGAVLHQCVRAVRVRHSPSAASN